MGFFTPLKNVTVILSSGARFTVRCEDVKITYSKQNGRLESYQFNGIRGTNPFYVSPLEVQAILID